MKELKTVEDFIAFYEAIPDEMWGIGAFHKNGRSCAIGHVGEGSENSNRLCRLWREYIQAGVTEVNDGLDEHWFKPKPKERILNALQKIKEFQLAEK